MAFCRKCGHGLTDGDAFCSACGADVRQSDGQPESTLPNTDSIGKWAMQTTAALKELLKAGKIKENIQSSLQSLGQTRIMYFLTTGMLLLNLILSFTDMIDISIFFSERSGSFYSIMKFFKDNTSSSDADFVLPILRICTTLIIISILLMSVPIFMGKAAGKKTAVFISVTMLLSFLVYLFLVIAYKSSDDYSHYIEIKFTAYIYLVQTLATFVSAIMLSKKTQIIGKVPSAVNQTNSNNGDMSNE
ncbi:MAG: zinc ribbon domain-containing protein [Clostridia bacterium]|nr:zinc ribbon domain-containing protein [Clostridia bacterium]